MALVNHALITVADALEELAIQPEATQFTARLERVIELCTAEIETFCKRQIRYRGTEFTEYFRFTEDAGRTNTLYVIDRPVFAVTSIKETNVQAAGDFWATITALTAGVDYVTDLNRGRIERLSSGWSNELRQSESAWYPSGMVSGLGGIGGPVWPLGSRAVQVKYKAGYEGIDSLPAEAPVLDPIFAEVCRQLVALKWKEIVRGMQGTTGVTDETGNFLRIGPAKLTNDMKDMLRDEVRSELTGNASRDTATP